MTWAWESAWDSVNDEFLRVADTVRACNSSLWWQCGHQENESFPFWAYASFGRHGNAGEEDVVISIDFKRSDGHLMFTSDISRGNGEILQDGPASEITLATDTGTVRQWIARSIDAALAFVSKNEDLLRRELC